MQVDIGSVTQQLVYVPLGRGLFVMHGVNRRELTKVSARQTVVSGAAVTLIRVFHNIQAHAP